MKRNFNLQELINSLTHAIGLALGIIGAIILCGKSYYLSELTANVIYSASLITIYLVSTYYHWLVDEPLKSTFRVADHVCIYLFIAGSYTPFMVKLNTPNSLLLLIFICLISILWALYKIYSRNRFAIVSSISYIILGWSCIFVIKDLMQLPWVTSSLFLVGGVMYTSGFYFYAKDYKKYYHAIWHIFTMLGTLCHYLAIFI